MCLSDGSDLAKVDVGRVAGVQALIAMWTDEVNSCPIVVKNMPDFVWQHVTVAASYKHKTGFVQGSSEESERSSRVWVTLKSRRGV